MTDLIAGTLSADGYGIRIHVQRGHLIVEDGIGQHRRERRFSRGQRDLQRIVIGADTGSITLDAIRWCADIGVSICVVDRTDRVVMTAGPGGVDEGRLRRQQALARDSNAGLTVTQFLLGAKLAGQADVLVNFLDLPTAAELIREAQAAIAGADTIGACRQLEAKAANVYFGAWCGRVGPRFASRDADMVPDHWLAFDARRTPLHGGKTPRNAATPVNALLNYGYALAEAECVRATRMLGLDPGFGLTHADRRDRDSFALDLSEAIRPDIDRYILTLLDRRRFRATDFHETREGVCRITPLLTHIIAADLSDLARDRIAPIAEYVCRVLAEASPGAVRIRRPLTRDNQRNPTAPVASSSTGPLPSVPSTCRSCGTALANSRRQLCAACWPVERRLLATAQAKGRVDRLAQLRETGRDPTQTAEAKRMHAEKVGQRKREHLAYDRTTGDRSPWDPEIAAAVADVPLSRIAAATGLSISACSRIRAHKLVPHRRHWDALKALGQ